MASDEVVSLQDVLEVNQQLEQDANAVLGDSDDSECTYPKVKQNQTNYVWRQVS